VITTSAILDIFGGMVEIVASNPASILIVLGFFAILGGIFIPLGIGTQLLLGSLGIVMMIIGVVVHVAWLQS
jgi:hypothetical protein